MVNDRFAKLELVTAHPDYFCISVETTKRIGAHVDTDTAITLFNRITKLQRELSRCAFIGPREAWVRAYCYARAHCNSFVYFSHYASARLILELDSKDLLFLFPALCVSTTSLFLLSFFSCLFAFLFLSRLLFLHRVELSGRIKNSGRWIGLNTSFKEWGDVERICNFAKMLTLRIFFSPRIFEFSEFFFNRKKITILRSFPSSSFLFFFFSFFFQINVFRSA